MLSRDTPFTPFTDVHAAMPPPAFELALRFTFAIELRAAAVHVYCLRRVVCNAARCQAILPMIVDIKAAAVAYVAMLLIG